jgi:hypothetical protein
MYDQPPFEGNWMAGTAASMNCYIPRTVRNAVRFIYAGAWVSVIAPVLNILSIGTLDSMLKQELATPASARSLYTVDGILIAGVVTIGLVDISVWLWMARKIRAGRSWARIVATIFFAINSLGLLEIALLPFPAHTKALQALSWTAGLGAIVLMWHRDSGAFFRVQSGRY